MQVDDQLPGLSVNGTLVENRLIVPSNSVCALKQMWLFLVQVQGRFFQDKVCKVKRTLTVRLLIHIMKIYFSTAQKMMFSIEHFLS